MGLSGPSHSRSISLGDKVLALTLVGGPGGAIDREGRREGEGGRDKGREREREREINYSLEISHIICTRKSRGGGGHILLPHPL